MDPRKSQLILYVFLLIFITTVTTPVVMGYSGGSGTAEYPYQIADANDLLSMSADTNNYDKCFILTADIDLDPNLPGGQVFTTALIAPDIDSSSMNFQGTAFTGTFDGNGHKIKLLIINAEGKEYIGLFGLISGALVKNLSLEDCNISGTYPIGGLVGENRGGCIISNCHATGSISGYEFVGGLVGLNRGIISNCCATSDVNGIFFYVGGLVGYNPYGNITSCYAAGNVNGGDAVGGLVGGNEGSIVNCYATGLEISGSDYVGGLVGSNGGSIVYCYAAGSVSGESYVGGLVNRNSGNVVNCYFLDTSGTDSFGIPLTDAQMKQQSSFLGWDFSTPIWEMCPDTNDYPHLWWEYYCNKMPVAVAGPNQIAYAFINGLADVTLDGSASYDEEDDPLDYYWSWFIDSNLFEANGVSPTIQLPVGEHQIELVVDDGWVESEPDYCTITVVEPLRTKLWLWPNTINCNSRPQNVTVMMYLPKDVEPGDVNDKPLTMYPCDIQSKCQRAFQMGRGRYARTVVTVLFEKDEICDCFDVGLHKVDVAGTLQTGRYFYGANMLRIIRPYHHKWPFRRFYRPQ